jgi:hypothetical protein
MDALALFLTGFGQTVTKKAIYRVRAVYPGPN